MGTLNFNPKAQFSESGPWSLVLNIKTCWAWLGAGDFFPKRPLQPREVIHMAPSQAHPQEGRGRAGFNHAPWVSAPRPSDASWTYHVLGLGWVIREAEYGPGTGNLGIHMFVPLLSEQASIEDLQCQAPCCTLAHNMSDTWSLLSRNL